MCGNHAPTNTQLERQNSLGLCVRNLSFNQLRQGTETRGMPKWHSYRGMPKDIHTRGMPKGIHTVDFLIS